MKARAEELSPGRIRFNHELIALEQDDDGVRRDDPRQRRRATSTRSAASTSSAPTAAAGSPKLDRRRLRRPRRGDPDGDAPRHRRLLALGDRPRRPDPLDLLAAGRASWRDGPDGSRALGPRLRGVGHPPQLPPPTCAQSDEQVEADVAQRPRHRRPADDDPQDHALDGRRGAGVDVPGRPRVPGRRRRAPPPADRRPRADQRDPRRPQPVLEARRGPRRPGVAGAARDLRGRAAPGRPAQLPALAGERRQPLRDRWRCSASRPSNSRRGEHGAAAPAVERAPGGRGAPPRRDAASCARSRWSSTS